MRSSWSSAAGQARICACRLSLASNTIHGFLVSKGVYTLIDIPARRSPSPLASTTAARSWACPRPPREAVATTTASCSPGVPRTPSPHRRPGALGGTVAGSINDRGQIAGVYGRGEPASSPPPPPPRGAGWPDHKRPRSTEQAGPGGTASCRSPGPPVDDRSPRTGWPSHNPTPKSRYDHRRVAKNCGAMSSEGLPWPPPYILARAVRLVGVARRTRALVLRLARIRWRL